MHFEKKKTASAPAQTTPVLPLTRVPENSSYDGMVSKQEEYLFLW